MALSPAADNATEVGKPALSLGAERVHILRWRGEAEVCGRPSPLGLIFTHILGWTPGVSAQDERGASTSR